MSVYRDLVIMTVTLLLKKLSRSDDECKIFFFLIRDSLFCAQIDERTRYGKGAVYLT
jgi:hypothetical protein